MTFPVVPAVGSTLLGAGLTEGARFLWDFVNRNQQKPAEQTRDLKSMKLSDMGDMTIGDYLKLHPIVTRAANQGFRSTQELEKSLKEHAEKLRQAGSSFDRDNLIATRKAAFGISEDERNASLKRTLEEANNTLGNTITDRGNRVTETLRLRTGETNLQEGVQGKNYARTMGILGEGNRQLQEVLDKIIDAGNKSQAEEMAFMERMYDRERASMNSPVNMIGRIAGIAGIALPAFALLGR